jgi:hypothetical protein
MAAAFLPMPTPTAIPIQAERKGETARASGERGRADTFFTPHPEMDPKDLDRRFVIHCRARRPDIRQSSNDVIGNLESNLYPQNY